MKNFIFEWFENIKFGEPTIRKNTVHARNAQDATAAFIRTFGNLKKNEIVSIQEIDKNGNPIGEPIVPMEGSSIIPIAK